MKQRFSKPTEGEWIWLEATWTLRDERRRENECMWVSGCLFSCKQLRLKGKEDWYPYPQNNECRNRMFGAYCTRWRDNGIVYAAASGKAAEDFHPLESFRLSFRVELLQGMKPLSFFNNISWIHQKKTKKHENTFVFQRHTKQNITPPKLIPSYFLFFQNSDIIKRKQNHETSSKQSLI